MVAKNKINDLIGKVENKVLEYGENGIILEVDSPSTDLNVWARRGSVNFEGKFLSSQNGRGFWRISIPSADSTICVYSTFKVNDYSEEEKKWQKHTQNFSVSASVVIPAHNRAGSLKYLLTSLAIQTYPKNLYEVIVSDYGSEDGTKDVVHEAIKNDKFKLRYIHSQYINDNPSKGRNEGIKASNGEVIICIDTDMLADPKLIEEYMKYYHCSGNIALIGRRIFIDPKKLTKEMITQNFNEVARLRCKSKRTGELEDSREERYRVTDMFKKEGMPWFYFSTCNVSFRKVDALNAGLFDENFEGWGYEDNEFAYKLFYHRPSIYIVPAMEAIAYHQEHDRDLSSIKLSDERNLERLFSKIETFNPNYS